MPLFVEYQEDGRIIATTLSSDANAQMPDGSGVLRVDDETVGINTHYVENDALAQKQPFPFTINTTEIVADGNDTATISGVPVGTQVEWHDGQIDIVNDGVVELATDLPRTYTLRFTAVPYLDQEVTIEAVAAA